LEWALKAGKINPAAREPARKFAATDLEGFEALLSEFPNSGREKQILTAPKNRPPTLRL
jgi:hypothetical protein